MSSTEDKVKIKEIFATLVDDKQKNNQRNSKNDGNASCNPQSKDLFLERVRTFTTTTWAAKPTELSPLRCAQYGWCNDDPDRLRCVTCNATIFAGIPDEWDSNAYSDICDKIKNDLRIGHEKLCPWPNNPCPPSFLSVPSQSANRWKSEIKASFSGLIELKGHLPELNEDAVAAMKIVDNSCIESLLSNIFKLSTESDDEGLQAKVACILAITGWRACHPIVEDPSISCLLCGKEIGLWHYRYLSSRSSTRKHNKGIPESIGTSQQSLSDLHDIMSSRASVKSEKSENSTHSGSVTHELSKLATSSDSLAQSDLLKPASSQESLINLRVSDSKQMIVDQDNDDDSSVGESSMQGSHHGGGGGHVMRPPLSDPRFPHVTPPELMKELLLSTAPGNRTHSIYSDSIFSEVGSECFEKRLEDTTEKDLELEKAITENPPASHPNHVQQQWMKELLFMTADNQPTEAAESVMSEIGSVSFDRRLESGSITTASQTPSMMQTFTPGEEEEGEPVRTKRMRFQEPFDMTFNMVGEHRHWCPWIVPSPDSPVQGEESNDESPTAVYNPIPSRKYPGWKSILLTLLPSLNRTESTASPPPPVEAWKSVRSVLGDCVSSSPLKT